MTKITALVFPTELEERVRQAIENIFPGTKLHMMKQKGYVDRLEGKAGLDTMHELLRTNRSWTRPGVPCTRHRGPRDSFQLSKQAAFMGDVNFLDQYMPLGGIYVNIEYSDPQHLINWLAPKTREGKPDGNRAMKPDQLLRVQARHPPFDWAYGLEDMGFHGWEIVSEGHQSLTPETLPELRDIIGSTDLQITVHGPFSDLNLRFRERCDLERDHPADHPCVEYPQIFLTSSSCTRAFYRRWAASCPTRPGPEHRGAQDTVETCEELWRHPVPGEHAGHGKAPVPRPSEIFGMIESVGRENIGMTFDVGHANTVKNVRTS